MPLAYSTPKIIHQINTIRQRTGLIKRSAKRFAAGYTQNLTPQLREASQILSNKNSVCIHICKCFITISTFLTLQAQKPLSTF